MTKREFLDIVFALVPNEANAIMDAFDEYVDSNEPHWIPVTERLPAMGKSVLMCDIDGDIYLGHRTQCGYYYPDFCGDRVKNVTAWCKLPEPYKPTVPPECEGDCGWCKPSVIEKCKGVTE